MTYKKKPASRVSTVSKRAWALNNVNTQFSSAIAPNGAEIKNFYKSLYIGAVYGAGVPAGGDVIAEEFMLPILTTYPIIPDNMYFTDVMEAADRLVIRVRNPTGGALTARAVVQTSPL